MTNSDKKIIDEAEIKVFLNLDPKKVSFQDIKTSYRKVICLIIKILKISYDIVTKAYNQNAGN